MIPRETRCDYVRVTNLLQRMTQEEETAFYEEMTKRGIMTKSRPKMVHTLTKEQWNGIIRPALLDPNRQPIEIYDPFEQFDDDMLLGEIKRRGFRIENNQLIKVVSYNF